MTVYESAANANSPWTGRSTSGRDPACMPGMSINRAMAVNALLGCAIGDCLGLPFENERLPLPAGWVGDRYLQPSPRWSDDTQQSLVLLDEVLRKGHLEPRSVMSRFVTMWREPPPARPIRGLFGLHRGTGRGFRHAVEQFAATGEFSPMPGRAGNGAAMRITAAAMMLGAGPDTRQQIVAVSRATHGVVESVDAALAVAETAWALARGERGPGVLRTVVAALPRGAVGDALSACVGSMSADEMLANLSSRTGVFAGAGHALGSPLAAVVLAITAPSLHSGLVAAIRLGGDTDSTAAMVGAMRAAVDGLAELPVALTALPRIVDLERWRDELPSEREWIELERDQCSV